MQSNRQYAQLRMTKVKEKMNREKALNIMLALLNVWILPLIMVLAMLMDMRGK